ncbi:MAG: hypothetical protein ABEJ97_07800 [Halobellus sp.]
MVPTRRRYLASAVACCGLAGCIGGGEPELVVANGFDERITADVTATRESDGRVVVDTRESVSADGRAAFQLTTDGVAAYRIQVVAVDRNAGGSVTWRVAESDGIRARLRPSGVDFSER